MSATALKNYGIRAGDVLGRLTIVKQYEGRSSNGKILFLCQCSCGNMVEREGQNLAKKSVFPKSCGCARKNITNRTAKESGFSSLAQDFYLGVLNVGR